MAKFLQGNELNAELEKIFKNAKQQLILISPYIKLHDRYISTLQAKKDNPNLELIILFGKNEEDMSKSMKQEDFNFFKEFPNIEIRYEKRLHAKYYCNDLSAILTSMNLYNYSQDNNIEAGVLIKSNIIGKIMTNFAGEELLDKAASEYFDNVLKQSDLLFKKIPEFESGMFGLSKKYKSSKIEVDLLTDFFENRSKYDNNSRKVKSRRKNYNYINSTDDSNIRVTVDSNNSIDKIEVKYLSTTALSKEVGISSKDLFAKFERLNWIERQNDNWTITETGKNKGAQIKKGRYGEFIAWPDSILNDIS